MEADRRRARRCPEPFVVCRRVEQTVQRRVVDTGTEQPSSGERRRVAQAAPVDVGAHDELAQVAARGQRRQGLDVPSRTPPSSRSRAVEIIPSST